MLGKFGFIGGPGLFRQFSHYREKKVKTPIPFQIRDVHTPYGVVQAKFGKIHGIEVVFISRHGDKETPERKPKYRANIWALQSTGVTRILSFSTGSSLNPKIPLGSVAVPDQYIDLTGEMYSFEGKASDMTEPFCEELRTVAYSVGDSIGLRMFSRATYAGIRGPNYETAAEAEMVTKMGGDIVGISAVPEAKLSREMSLCYQPVVMIVRFPEGYKDVDAYQESIKVVARLQGDMVRMLTDCMAYLPKVQSCRCRLK
jgi:5'-methylthioadenosine phosphorylase